MTEHKTKIRTLGSDSKIVEHILQYKHEFDLSKVETLTHESNWRRRVIKESLLTSKTHGNAINDTKHSLRVF